MKGPKALFERDTLINNTIQKIVEIVKRKRLEKDRREQWFANNQLDNLRQLLEREGYQTAKTFQMGKVEKRDKRQEFARWEIVRNETLLDILNTLGNSDLDVMICSYILGKLNSIIDESLKKEKKNE